MQPFPHPNHATHEIWSRLAHWLQRYLRLKVWTTTDDDDGRRTDDGPLVYYKLILWAFGSGELTKIREKNAPCFKGIWRSPYRTFLYDCKSWFVSRILIFFKSILCVQNLCHKQMNLSLIYVYWEFNRKHMSKFSVTSGSNRFTVSWLARCRKSQTCRYRHKLQLSDYEIEEVNYFSLSHRVAQSCESDLL